MSTSTAAGVRIPLHSLCLDEMTCGWGEPQGGKSVEEQALTINGHLFADGVGTHADSEFTIRLEGRAQRFSAMVGVDDEVLRMGEGRVRFLVYADGECRADSGVVASREGPVALEADLAGAQLLRLEVRGVDGNTHLAHADWADACIELAPQHTALPLEPQQVIRLLPDPDCRRAEPGAPVLSYPRIVGATPGRAFVFRIPASGAGSLSFEAPGLPASLQLDTRTGVVRGTAPAQGRYDIPVTVRGAQGSCCETLTLVTGPGALCPAPPMGWNSWNVWGLAVDQDKVARAAEVMVSSGLAAHGYQYVNIDDGWEAGRDADGAIQCNEKFPDMAGLGEYIHSLGLRFGIYSSPGPQTCGGFTGSYGHEEQDARTWASWGVDFIKYDWCSYHTIARDRSAEELQKPYRVMQQALAGLDRDIVYSLCQYGMGDVWKWGADVGAQLWRTTGDIVDTWPSLRSIGFRHNVMAPWSGPGRWNDPDMLVLGKVGWGPTTHMTRLTRHEQLTHMSLWCLLGAPLLIGCDLEELDEWTLTLLTNTEALAVNQDPLGAPAVRNSVAARLQIWSRPLSDGSHAVGLFNLGASAQVCSLPFEQLGIGGPAQVRDLWEHGDRGTFTEAFSADVPQHGVVLLRITAV